MKRLCVCISAVLVLLALCVGTSAKEVSVTVSGYVKQEVTLDDLQFDAEADFNAPTTSFQPNLARASEILVMAGANQLYETYATSVTETLGFDGLRFFGYQREEGDPLYRTGHYFCMREVTRNGRPCTLALISMYSNTGGNSMTENFDFVNQRINGEETDYSSEQALTFTEAAKDVLYGYDAYILEQLDALESAYQKEGKDFLVWVCGHSRGAAVGNYLAKLLVDRYGTGHVFAYLGATPNVDKTAKGPDDTSRYNCIFNILNPDDAVTYVPFGKEYKNWGFARWGVEVYLRAPAQDAALAAALQKRYGEITKNCASAKSRLLDGTYYYFDSESTNGVAISALISLAAETLAPTVEDYYTKSVNMKSYSDAAVLSWAVTGLHGVKVKNEQVIPFTLIEQLAEIKGERLDIASVVSLYGLLQGSYYNKCEMTELLHLILDYALGADDLDTLAEGYFNGSQNFTFREGGCAHLVEAYLAWLSLYLDGVNVMRDTLPQDSKKCIDQCTSNGVSVTAEDAFYSDQTFCATKSTAGYQLRLSYADKSACEPYDAVTLRIPCGTRTDDTLWAMFVEPSGRSTLLRFTRESAQDTYAAQTSRLNGELVLPDGLGTQGSQMLVTGLDKNGQTQWVRRMDAEDGETAILTDQHTQKVRLMLLNDAFVPCGSAGEFAPQKSK